MVASRARSVVDPPCSGPALHARRRPALFSSMVNHTPAGDAGVPATEGRVLLQILEHGGAMQMQTPLEGADALALLLAAAIKVGDDIGQRFQVVPTEQLSRGGIVLPGPRPPVQRPQ